MTPFSEKKQDRASRKLEERSTLTDAKTLLSKRDLTSSIRYSDSFKYFPYDHRAVEDRTFSAVDGASFKKFGDKYVDNILFNDSSDQLGGVARSDRMIMADRFEITVLE